MILFWCYSILWYNYSPIFLEWQNQKLIQEHVIDWSGVGYGRMISLVWRNDLYHCHSIILEISPWQIYCTHRPKLCLLWPETKERKGTTHIYSEIITHWCMISHGYWRGGGSIRMWSKLDGVSISTQHLVPVHKINWGHQLKVEKYTKRFNPPPKKKP